MRQARLVIFARYPTPGRVKTRLIPALGEAGAARLQDAMTRHALRQGVVLADRGAAGVEVRFTGAGAPAMAHRYGHSFTYVAQGEGSLGERLARAAADALHGGERAVILLGADCPAATAEVLSRAVGALSAGNELVLGPAADGGYYLIGLRRFVPQLFEGIEWGTRRVLAQTLAAADRFGLSRVLLPTLPDVDVPADLPACFTALPQEPEPYRPERIAITGATGCLGRHFLDHVLREKSDTHVTALVRNDSRAFAHPAFCELVEGFGNRLTLIDADLRRPEITAAQRRSLTEADGGLWHFAACTNLHPTSAAAARETGEVNRDGTARLVAMLGQSDRPGPLFHVSTAYVCGRRIGDVFEHELDGGPGFRNAYECSKHAAETRVRHALDAGLTGAILRPSLVIGDSCGAGPGDIVDLLAAAFAAARSAARSGRRLALPMPATAAVNAVPVAWVVRMMHALANRHHRRQTYHLTAPSDTTIGAAAAAGERVFGPLDLDFAAGLPNRLLRRMLLPFRPYFDANVRFDRTNLELDVTDVSTHFALDLSGVFRARARPVPAPQPPAAAAR